MAELTLPFLPMDQESIPKENIVYCRGHRMSITPIDDFCVNNDVIEEIINKMERSVGPQIHPITKAVSGGDE